MVTDNIISSIKSSLGENVLGFQGKSARRLYVDITPETVSQASTLIYQELGARFQIATGVDTPAGIEVMYHWALDEQNCVVTFRAVLPHENPELDSIAGLCPAAEWIEREMWELLGINFRGHPDLRHLLLDDDWPEGNYPLRRDHGVSP